MSNILTIEDLKQILNGKEDTLITVQYGSKGIYFTYLIRPTAQPYAKDICLYQRLSLNHVSHRYLGTVYTDEGAEYTKTPRAVYPNYWDKEYKYWPPSVKTFDNLIDHIAASNTLGDMTAYRCVRCKFCGKMLTQPRSILAGAGPGCEKTIIVNGVDEQ